MRAQILALVVLTAAETNIFPVASSAPLGTEASAAALDIVSRLEADDTLLREVTRELAAREKPLAVASEGRRLAGSFHSVFGVTCHPGQPGSDHCMFLEWRWYGLWLAVLVIVTVLIETVLHNIEHHIEEDGHSLLAHIYHKIIKELALLGLVSFTAIVLGNIPGIGHELKAGSTWRFIMLEIAHVMIFVCVHHPPDRPVPPLPCPFALPALALARWMTHACKVRARALTPDCGHPSLASPSLVGASGWPSSSAA